MSTATRLSFFLLSMASVSALPEAAYAFPQFPEQLPNRAYTLSSITGDQRPCITCHNNPDGGQGCVTSSGLPANTAPCLNPFGLDFRTNNKIWSQPLSQLDSDGDGFTNGQELQDPTGTWVYGQQAVGKELYATRPGFNTDSPGLHDEDDDEVCWFGTDVNNDGDCIDAGENASGYDCDDSDVLSSSAAAEICTNSADNDCNGLPTFTDPACATVIDNDGDRFCETGRDLNLDGDCVDAGENGGDVDCNDGNSTVYPGAPVNCIDGIDNDCDGLIDLADVIDCDVKDDDGDGYCPAGRDLDGDGQCTSPGEALPVSDCLDVAPEINPNSANVSPGIREVCGDGLDNDCDGKPDYADDDCKDLIDADDDGYCPKGSDLNNDGNCGGAGEATVLKDCDDANNARSPGLTEICYDAIDNDCDGDNNLADTDCVRFRDLDEDGFCPNGEDTNKDGDCIDFDRGKHEYQVPRTDCDDTSPIAKPRNSEQAVENGCFDGVDTDCDGQPDGFDFDCANWADKDLDGFCPFGIDGNKDGDCTDAGEATEAAQDCDNRNAAKSPGVQENCTDGADNNCDTLTDKADLDCKRDLVGDATDYLGDNDQDGDGYCPLGTDVNKDGDCNDLGENMGSDCNDADPKVYRGAPENTVALCKDNVDNDCDGNADTANKSVSCGIFVDDDNDGFCERGQDKTFDGDCLDGGEQTAAVDCDDAAPTASPIRIELCTDGIDNNCNGLVDYLDSAICACEDDSQCNDGVACTMDTCTKKKCKHDPVAMCMDGGVMPVTDAGGDTGGSDNAGSGTGSNGDNSSGSTGSANSGGVDAGDEVSKSSPDCSINSHSQTRMSWLGLSAALSLFIMRRRRRSAGC